MLGAEQRRHRRAGAASAAASTGCTCTRTSTASTRSHCRPPWRWRAARSTSPRCSGSPTTTGSTSSRARAAPRPKADCRRRARFDRARRLAAWTAILKIDTYNMQATVQCGVPLQALEDAVPQARRHDRPFAAVEADRADGRPRRDAQHRPVLDALRRHRGHGRRLRGRVRRTARSRGSRTFRAARSAPTSATS